MVFTSRFGLPPARDRPLIERPASRLLLWNEEQRGIQHQRTSGSPPGDLRPVVRWDVRWDCHDPIWRAKPEARRLNRCLDPRRPAHARERRLDPLSVYRIPKQPEADEEHEYGDGQLEERPREAQDSRRQRAVDPRQKKVEACHEPSPYAHRP